MAARSRPSNAASLMHVPEVNGALVGGASLKAEEFWAIALAAADDGLGGNIPAGEAPEKRTRTRAGSPQWLG